MDRPDRQRHPGRAGGGHRDQLHPGGAGIGASIGWFTCGGLSGNLDLACLARETAAGAAGGAVAAIPGVGILGGLGVAGGAGIAESLVRQGMQGGIDPLQVGIDGMLSAATFGIARHTLGPLVQRLRGAHLTRQTGPVSIQPGSHLATPRPPAGPGTEIVERAMSRAELQATLETGLVRGGRGGTHYVSGAVNHSTQRARQRLALPQTPEVRVRMEVPSGVFSPPKTVDPAFRMPGGGLERTATGPVACRIICVWDY